MSLPHGPSQSGSGDEDRGTDSIKRFDAVWTMVEREVGAYAQWRDVDRLLDDIDSWEKAFETMKTSREAHKTRAEKLEAALKEQHAWHLEHTDRRPVYFGDSIGQVNADEYQESEMYRKTMAALEAKP